MRADGLAGGEGGADRLGELIPLALRGMAAGVAERGGPVPAGGPAQVTGLTTGSKVVSVGAQKLDAGTAVRAIERTPDSATATVAESSS